HRLSLSLNQAGALEIAVLKDQEFHRLPMALAEGRRVFPFLLMSLTPAAEGQFALIVQWGPEYGRLVFRAGA
ncbi:MAG: hypothetical protein ACE5GL_06175, partial [Calditrichia bacterium]